MKWLGIAWFVSVVAFWLWLNAAAYPEEPPRQGESFIDQLVRETAENFTHEEFRTAGLVAISGWALFIAGAAQYRKTHLEITKLKLEIARLRAESTNPPPQVANGVNGDPPG